MPLITELLKSIQEKLRIEITDATTRNQYSWWLLEALLHKTKAELLMQRTLTLTPAQERLLHQWLDDITIKHKPLAYILATVPFGPLTLQMRPPILIARPETEEWMLTLLEKIKKGGAKQLRILDLCSGSGCMGLLAAYLLPDAHVDAIDINEEAIALINENKKALNINNIDVIQSNLFEKLHNKQYDIIISNPPYISTQEYAELEPSVKLWEDKGALVAANNGLALIQKIVAQTPMFIRANEYLKKSHINQLYIEIGWQQATSVTKLMQKYGYVAITIAKDSANKDRVVSGRIDNVATATI